MTAKLQPRQVNSGFVTGSEEDGYCLQLDKLNEANYSLAQIDDYMDLPRRKFQHKPPMKFQIEARLSDQTTPGTWGFGLWNDPFGMGFGGGGMSRILPVLPNAAWFFFGSDENALTLRDDKPGEGFHVKTFRSPLLPSFVSLIGLPLAPLFLWPTTARILRGFGRSLVKEDGMTLKVDVEIWHSYCLSWDDTHADFCVDNDQIFSTEVVPRGRLGVVIWIDNQYFRFTRSGKLGFGFLPIQEEQWMQVRNISLEEK